MPGPPCTQEAHHLRIDIDFDRILTIIFPHASWATTFLDHLESHPYHDDCRARLDDDYTVSMKLPKNVDRMHIGLSTGASEGGAVALVFDSKRCVRDWLVNSPLWEASRSGSVDGERSAVIRTKWTHVEFERCMDIRERRRKKWVNVNVVSVRERQAPPAPVAANAADHDVIGKAHNSRDPEETPVIINRPWRRI